jgi:hypothetical protein
MPPRHLTPHKKVAAHCAASIQPCGDSAYFEIERLNMRSIFSLVASTADWLA